MILAALLQSDVAPSRATSDCKRAASIIGYSDGVLSITVAVGRSLSDGLGGVTTDFLRSRLKCTLLGAQELQRAIDDAQLLAMKTTGGVRLASIPPQGVFFAKRLDIFWLLIIELGELIPRFRMAAQELVELGMDGLRVSMRGTLNDKRHHPCGERRDGVPLEC